MFVRHTNKDYDLGYLREEAAAESYQATTKLVRPSMDYLGKVDEAIFDQVLVMPFLMSVTSWIR